MKLTNLTPHAIVLQAADGTRTTVPPSGTVARVGSVPGELLAVDGVPVPVAEAAAYGPVDGLPEVVDPTIARLRGLEPTLYIVSAMVLARCAGRRDVVAPGTGPNDGAIRNAAGQIEAVTRLVRG